MKDEGLENSVITLSASGWPIRRIAREPGISRVRIRRILGLNTGARDTTGESLICFVNSIQYSFRLKL